VVIPAGALNLLHSGDISRITVTAHIPNASPPTPERGVDHGASGSASTPAQHLSRVIDGDGGQQRRDSGPHFAETLVRG
jgi:hypothetical protein